MDSIFTAKSEGCNQQVLENMHIVFYAVVNRSKFMIKLSTWYRNKYIDYLNNHDKTISKYTKTTSIVNKLCGQIQYLKRQHSKQG